MAPFPVAAAMLLAAALTASTLRAHGGAYRGPSGVTCPSSGGGSGSQSGGTGTGAGGATGGSSGGTSGAPSGSGQTGSGGANAGPGLGASGKAATGGAALGPDLGRWQYWWEFNKDEVLALRQTLRQQALARGQRENLLGMRRPVQLEELQPPTEEDVNGRIRPALLEVLATAEQRDLVSGAMVALAKVSRGEADARDQFVRRLQSRDQEIRETAALALGIAGNPEALPLLADLFADTEQGRALVDRTQVDYRTRAFAGYALGLIAHAAGDADVKLRAFAALQPALRADVALERNLRVAAVLAVRMLDLDAADARLRVLRDEAVRDLLAWYQARLGPGEEWQQAHAPLAICRLLGRGDSTLHQEVEGRLLQELRAPQPRGDAIVQSAALALGHLAWPPESAPVDAEISAELRRLQATARDWQVRVYALQSLGRIGGEQNRRHLLDRLAKGRQLEQAWTAIALGLSAYDAGRPDFETGVVLLSLLAQVKDPEVRGAFAVALGLVGHQAALEDLRRMLAEYRHQDELCGYVCIGLSLLGDRSIVPALQDIVARSLRRPELLTQAAVALGRIGDYRAQDQMREVLLTEDVSVARLGAAAAALAQIGDRRCIEPLLKILQEPKQIPLARAFSAVALGGMADKAPLPWNASIGRDLNYRAAVETLTGDGAGVLDIF